jgi:predicted transcriptional regulator
VIEVDLVGQCVIFGRPIVRYTVQREGDTIVWDAAMVRALRAHLGVNQSELAGLLGVRQQTVSEWETAAYAPTRASSKHLTMVAERADFPFDAGRVENE